MKKKVLGRGLEALIPATEEKEAASLDIDIDRVTPNPDQPRLHLDEQGLNELAASIREHGILQPILVRPYGAGYQLVAGERRLSAAQRAGLLKIPAIIRDIPDDRLLELALVENIQREQLNAIEEAQAYQNLIDTLDTTQETLAQRLGKDRSTIANSLRLLKLPAPVKLLVGEGKLTPGHARALLSSNSTASELARVAALMVAKGWSVREAERWAKNQNHRSKRESPPPRDPNEAAAIDRLRVMYGTRVEILSGNDGKGGGQIRFHFYSQDDLVRIYGMLTEKRH